MYDTYHDELYYKSMMRLLAVKDSDIRLLTLKQCDEAIDRGIHIGGAFSAVIPLVSLFYGNNIDLDVENPTAQAQDKFVISKGHAVASMASIYADLGYFDRSVLSNSRSLDSILNGHPGPVLPGVHISTGPLGQGVGVAQGFAMAGRESPVFDVYALAGDGELQEGLIWESVMFAGQKKLDNLCVLVDANLGQLDRTTQMVLPMGDIASKFEAFGWHAVEADATSYGPVYDAISRFKHGRRDGRPTVIICHSVKGFGGFSSFMNGHKVTISPALMAQEKALQEERRSARISDLAKAFAKLDEASREKLAAEALGMNIKLEIKNGAITSASPIILPVKTKRAPVRCKKIKYNPDELLKIEPDKNYAASAVITSAMKIFAKDGRVMSADSDLSSTSGLEEGISWVDIARAVNAGIAEANMMNIGEAYAAMGYNAWVSTFCPFFDWKVLRRIAIGYQERLEDIESGNGWLNEGHGLDITFVATAPNFETKTNGATHMGNDDVTVLGGLAHLKIIDVSCPEQLLAIMRWIADGNKGLVYLRIMRDGSPVLYKKPFDFEYGKGYMLKDTANAKAVIISSGRQVHESLACAETLEKHGIKTGVVDMPSIDEDMLLSLYDSGATLIVAEQNNGFIYSSLMHTLFKNKRVIDSARVMPINSTGAEQIPHYIHSGTYEQLTRKYGLDADSLAENLKNILK